MYNIGPNGYRDYKRRGLVIRFNSDPCAGCPTGTEIIREEA
jgi:hypothetical protein